MANVISDETMEYVGILAKLELSDAEKEAAKKDMESMLDYIDKLNELDTSNVEPMSHVFPVQNVFREDVVENGDGGEDTLANAPERSASFNRNASRKLSSVIFLRFIICFSPFAKYLFLCFFFNSSNWNLSINSLNFPLFSRLPAIENSIYVSFSLVFALMG